MTYLQTFILAIVEGVTEFLPISSTGHLVLASHLLNIPKTEFLKSFEIIIQLGAILAVVFLYRNTLLHSSELWKKILVAFIPTGILGLLLYKIIKTVLLGNEMVTLAALFLGGIALIVLELFYKENPNHVEKIENITYKQALLIGLFQSISMIPGVSRAAATIVGALLVGTKRKAAVEFSFLLAIPTMAAATGLDIVKSNFSFTLNEIGLLCTGLIGSFVVALYAIKWLTTFVKTHTLIPFGIYRIVLSTLYWILLIQ